MVGGVGEVGFKVGEGGGHVFAAEAETDVAGFVVDGAGEKKDRGVADEGFAELLNVLLGLEAGEADGGGVGRGPIEEIGAAGEEIREQREIVADDRETAVNKFLAVAEGQGGEEFGRSAGTDGGVVLQRN